MGGAEDKISDRRILARFVELCGGPEGRVAVVPTASMLPTTGDAYRRVFRELGIADVVVIDVAERAHAEEERWSDALEGVTGIFLTGGNQLRLSTILGGTPIATRIRRMNARGVHVAGTSAGAAFICEHMIAHGASGSTPRAGQVALAPGLGLTNRIIIDQHFRERDRLGRLLTALSYNPFSIGFGLDEDTAAFIDPRDHAHVVGSGGITIVDVSQLAYSSMALSEVGDPVELVGVRLHILSNGAAFDLSSRIATPGPHRPADPSA
ncbi:MAG: cyanophycinase [Myxococcales bacterium]|nr:cyanophycinase [Myxococcales bacterium]